MMRAFKSGGAGAGSTGGGSAAVRPKLERLGTREALALSFSADGACARGCQHRLGATCVET